MTHRGAIPSAPIRRRKPYSLYLLASVRKPLAVRCNMQQARRNMTKQLCRRSSECKAPRARAAQRLSSAARAGRTIVTEQDASAATFADTLPSKSRINEFCRAPITMWST